MQKASGRVESGRLALATKFGQVPARSRRSVHRIAANLRVACDAPAYLARRHFLHNAGSPPPSCLVIERASGPLDRRGAER